MQGLGNVYSNTCICVLAEKLDDYVVGPQDEVKYRFETVHADYNRRMVFEVVGYTGQFAVGAGYPFEFKIIDPPAGE